MTQTVVLLLFALLLFFSLIAGIPLWAALLAGWALFFSYGLRRGHKPGALFAMSMQGMRRVGGMLFIFLLVGMLTAVWRACGAIAFIVYHASQLITPPLFFVLAFVLCGFVSTLMGTSLGTAATMGVICMAMADAMGANRLLAGGAILSGVYLGDRCSPMSTSAHLVCTLTGTDIYQNIRRMVKTSLVPLAISAVLYVGAGLLAPARGAAAGSVDMLRQHFVLSPWTFLPPAMIILLSICKVHIRLVIMASIAAAIGVAHWVQGMPLSAFPRLLAFGFAPQDTQVAKLLSGGGILSMLTPSAIVLISSTYSGLFDGTGLLGGLNRQIAALSLRASPFGAVAIAAAGAAMVACNQTLCTMLTHQLCRPVIPDRQQLAIDLENTAVVIAPLIPWNIAGAIPLATVGAPIGSIIAAWYLMLLPLWNFFVRRRGHTKK